MRATLNAILAFIGAESLTDEEFEAISIEDPSEPEHVYDALVLVLESRGSVGGMPERLRYYYLAKGLDFSAPAAQSNIFIGTKL